MRILWASNAPWVKSGYGNQTRQVVKRLARDGHAVAVAANFGLNGNRMTTEDGIPVLPQGKTQYSTDIIPAHYDWWMRNERGWLLTLYDAWVYPDDERWKAMNFAGWIPVDHSPAPPEVVRWARSHYPIAMSRFGQKALEDKGVKAQYVPHALEGGLWKPTELLPSSQQPARKLMAVPDDAFLIMINAANVGTASTPRKGWSEMALAVSLLMQKHDDVFLYVHSSQMGAGGIPLSILFTAAGIKPDRLRWVDQYAYDVGAIEEDDMAALYTAADVLLATSYGEGFCIPIVEAQATGTPVIVSDWTAQPELVGAGWKVPTQPFWNAPHGAFFGTPIIAYVVEALEQAYNKRNDTEMAAAAMAKAAEYDADRVYEEHWKPVIADMDSRLRPTEKRAQRRAQGRQAKKKR